MKVLLSLRKYLALIPEIEPLIHDAYGIYLAVQAGKLDDPATEAAALDLGKRLIKIVGWVEAHGASASA